MYHVLTIIIRATTDIDVLVLAVAVASVLDGCELWLAFGHGVKFRNIPVRNSLLYPWDIWRSLSSL